MRTTWSRAAANAVMMLGCAVAVTGCGGDSITGPATPEDVVFNPSLGIDLDTFTQLPSGVWIRTVVEGEGDPVTSGRVTVEYELRLVDGSIADPGNEPLSFVIGANPPEVIPGFEIGVTGMRVGEERRILVPSNLGYGSGGFGPIPPNAVLVFRVTLLSTGEPGGA